MEDDPQSGGPKKKRTWSNSISLTARISVAFLVILHGLYVLTNAGSPSGIELDPTLVIVALVPFFVWLVVSGKLKELRAPGFDAIFQDFLRAFVEFYPRHAPLASSQIVKAVQLALQGRL